MEAAVVPTLVQKFAGGGCEVRKVREVEGGRDALLAAKAAIVQESVASGCSLLNRSVKCGPFLYEVVDEAECRVYVGVSRNISDTNHDLRRRGVLCDGRVVRKVRDVPVGMSDAEAKADLIAESVASGCRLLNTQRQRGKEKQAGCVFELVDRAGQRVFVGKAASMEAAVVPTLVQKFAGGGCEVRKVREVEGGRDALLAAKAAVVQESVASGCSLLNYRVKCGPFLYEVVDEAECRVFVGVSRNMYGTNHDLQRSGVLCDGRVVRKVRNVPVGMSDAEAKADLIAESVASGCRLLNTQRQRGKEKQAGCVFELVDRAGQRVYVGKAASMEAAVVPTLVQKFAGGGCEVRKVREVEGGRDALLAAKTAVVAESVASGCLLLNDCVMCGPILYEVVDEAECRVFVGVSRYMYHTNRNLHQCGVLCDGRVVRKVRNVPVGMSAAEAKYDLIAESVASGCRLLNTRRQRKKEKQAGCVFELVDRAGQRVFVGTAASMEAAVVPRGVQKFAGGGCEVRKVREVEGGRVALLAAKAAVVQESVASGCSLLNDRVKCGPFLYEVVDEAECRVFVGVSRNMYGTNHDLRRSGVLCDGRVVRKVRNVPVGMSDAEAKADLIAESVASGCFVENAAVVRFDGERDVAASLRFMSRLCDPQSCPDAFHAKHAATLARHRVGPCPTSRDEGVVYALYDDSLSVVYVGQTQFSAVHRAKTHVQAALRTDRKRKTRLHAAMLRHGKPFHVAPLEKIDVRLSHQRPFRKTAVARERHYISVLKPTLNTVFRRLACRPATEMSGLKTR